MINREKGSAGLVILLIAFVAGALTSGVVVTNKKGEVKVDKQVVAARQAVDYSKMND